MKRIENNKYNSKQIKEILESIRTCTLLFITKDGKIDCSIAEDFLTWINGYAQYCLPEKKEEWNEKVRSILFSTLVAKPKHQDDPSVQELVANNEYSIIDNLYNFMNAGEIMQTYDETKSWDEVAEILDKQGHSGWTFSGLMNVMIEFSLIGPQFVEHFDPDRLDRDPNFHNLYKESQEYLKNRQELNKRLIIALAQKNHQ